MNASAASLDFNAKWRVPEIDSKTPIGIYEEIWYIKCSSHRAMPIDSRVYSIIYAIHIYMYTTLMTTTGSNYNQYPSDTFDKVCTFIEGILISVGI